jgi:hypothetical protein
MEQVRGRLNGGAKGNELRRLGDRHGPSGEPLHHSPPGFASCAAADEDQRGRPLDPGGARVDRLERVEQPGDGALVGGHENRLWVGVMAKPEDRGRGIGEIRRSLAVEEGRATTP